MTSIDRNVSVADVTDDNNTDSQKNISDNGSIIESPIEEAKPKTILNCNIEEDVNGITVSDNRGNHTYQVVGTIEIKGPTMKIFNKLIKNPPTELGGDKVSNAILKNKVSYLGDGLSDELTMNSNWNYGRFHTIFVKDGLNVVLGFYRPKRRVRKDNIQKVKDKIEFTRKYLSYLYDTHMKDIHYQKKSVRNNQSQRTFTEEELSDRKMFHMTKVYQIPKDLAIDAKRIVYKCVNNEISEDQYHKYKSQSEAVADDITPRNRFKKLINIPKEVDYVNLSIITYSGNDNYQEWSAGEITELNVSKVQYYDIEEDIKKTNYENFPNYVVYISSVSILYQKISSDTIVNLYCENLDNEQFDDLKDFITTSIVPTFVQEIDRNACKSELGFYMKKLPMDINPEVLKMIMFKVNQSLSQQYTEPPSKLNDFLKRKEINEQRMLRCRELYNVLYQVRWLLPTLKWFNNFSESEQHQIMDVLNIITETMDPSEYKQDWLKGLVFVNQNFIRRSGFKKLDFEYLIDTLKSEIKSSSVKSNESEKSKKSSTKVKCPSPITNSSKPSKPSKHTKPKRPTNSEFSDKRESNFTKNKIKKNRNIVDYNDPDTGPENGYYLGVVKSRNRSNNNYEVYLLTDPDSVKYEEINVRCRIRMRGRKKKKNRFPPVEGELVRVDWDVKRRTGNIIYVYRDKVKHFNQGNDINAIKTYRRLKYPIDYLKNLIVNDDQDDIGNIVFTNKVVDSHDHNHLSDTDDDDDNFRDNTNEGYLDYVKRLDEEIEQSINMNHRKSDYNESDDDSDD